MVTGIGTSEFSFNRPEQEQPIATISQHEEE